MDIDDSFKKPGAVPFKWEIRPGVPKIHHQPPSQSPSDNLRPSLVQQHQQHVQQSINLHHSCPLKLSPPPAGFYLHPPTPELRARSNPRSRSDRYRFDRSILARPKTVASGCFPTPLMMIFRRRDDNKRSRRPKHESDMEPDFTSELGTLSRWSGSTRESLSLFRDSPVSSFSSYQSSPRPVSDAEWAGFGLF